MIGKFVTAVLKWFGQRYGAAAGAYQPSGRVGRIEPTLDYRPRHRA